MRKSAWFTLLCVLSFASFHAIAVTTIVCGHFRYTPASTISLQYYADPIAYIEGHKDQVQTTVENNSFTLRIDIDHTISINVMNGDNWLFYNKFISPGDSIHFDFDTDKIDIEGRGENCMAFMFEHEEKFLKNPEVNNEFNGSVRAYISAQFALYWRKLRLDQLDYLHNYFKNKILPEPFRKAMEAEINYDCAVHLAQYWMDNREHAFHVFQDTTLMRCMREIPFDDTAAIVSNNYLHYLRELPYGLWSTTIDRNAPMSLFKYAVDNQYKLRDSISKNYFTRAPYEMALYTILYEKINLLERKRGLTDFEIYYDNTDSVVNALIGGLTNKEHIERLKQKLKSMYFVKKPAPDFITYNLRGNKVNLSEFKGKAVYIDFWATNCAPCIEELWYIKHLREIYGDKIIFLFVSFDNDYNAWRKSIAENSFISGIHVIDPCGFQSDVAVKYNISGMPWYILVDKEGNQIFNDTLRLGMHPEDIIRNALK